MHPCVGTRGVRWQARVLFDTLREVCIIEWHVKTLDVWNSDGRPFLLCIEDPNNTDQDLAEILKSQCPSIGLCEATRELTFEILWAGEEFVQHSQRPARV